MEPTPLIKEGRGKKIDLGGNSKREELKQPTIVVLVVNIRSLVNRLTTQLLQKLEMMCGNLHI